MSVLTILFSGEEEKQAREDIKLTRYTLHPGQAILTSML